MSKKQSQEYRGNTEHEWEQVNIDSEDITLTRRLRVPGGWLYNVVMNVGNPEIGDMNKITTTFVPMPEVVKHKV